MAKEQMRKQVPTHSNRWDMLLPSLWLVCTYHGLPIAQALADWSGRTGSGQSFPIWTRLLPFWKVPQAFLPSPQPGSSLLLHTAVTPVMWRFSSLHQFCTCEWKKCNKLDLIRAAFYSFLCSKIQDIRLRGGLFTCESQEQGHTKSLGFSLPYHMLFDLQWLYFKLEVMNVVLRRKMEKKKNLSSVLEWAVFKAKTQIFCRNKLAHADFQQAGRRDKILKRRKIRDMQETETSTGSHILYYLIWYLVLCSQLSLSSSVLSHALGTSVYSGIKSFSCGTAVLYITVVLAGGLAQFHYVQSYKIEA